MKKFTLRFAFLAISIFALAACQPAEAPTEPVLENAWIRSMPPGMKMTAGFGALRNVTDEKLEIVSFSSPQFRDVSLHLTEEVDGVSHMSEVDSITLCAGESLDMAPGGYHLMLMGPLVNMAPGQTVTVEFGASDERSFRFDVPVEKR